MLYQWSFSHLKLSFVDIDENTDFKELLKSEIDVPISSQFFIYIKASIDSAN